MRTQTARTTAVTPRRSGPVAVPVQEPAPAVGRRRHEELEAILRDRQREMQHVLQTRVRHAPYESLGGGRDETEYAEAEIQDHLDVALLQMKGDALDRVREALIRLEAGEYGRCDECGEEIAAKRLKAMPFAVRCTVCEDLHEREVAQERRARAGIELP